MNELTDMCIILLQHCLTSFCLKIGLLLYNAQNMAYNEFDLLEAAIGTRRQYGVNETVCDYFFYSMISFFIYGTC